LQNYAAAGAVILAYYTSKINIKVAAPAVIVLGFVFTWAIWSNVQSHQRGRSQRAIHAQRHGPIGGVGRLIPPFDVQDRPQPSSCTIIRLPLDFVQINWTAAAAFADATSGAST
jgi:hypothetical protein